jgi:hypothetical protein
MQSKSGRAARISPPQAHEGRFGLSTEQFGPIFPSHGAHFFQRGRVEREMRIHSEARKNGFGGDFNPSSLYVAMDFELYAIISFWPRC